MGKDMKNDTLGWALAIIFDSNGGIIRDERWTRAEVPEEPAEPQPESIEHDIIG